MSAVELAVLALAAFRITRLLVRDTVADDARNWVFTRCSEFVAEMLSCHWCAGWWVSLVLGGLYWLAPGVAVALALPWALSAAVGLAAAHLDPEDDGPAPEAPSWPVQTYHFYASTGSASTGTNSAFVQTNPPDEDPPAAVPAVR